MSKEVVVLFDAGHGGSDHGAIGFGLQEKNLTLAIALAARKHLLDNYDGVRVLMTRTDDRTLSLPARTNMAINEKVDSLVSIHINSAANNAAKGYEDFRHTSQSATSASGRLQAAIHRQVSPLFSVNRGMKQANFHMVREATNRTPSIPSVLTECGFIVNRDDNEQLKKGSFLTSLGVAHADAVAAFHGLKRKQQRPELIPPPPNAMKLGSITMKQDAAAYARPEWGTETGRVWEKGSVRNIYGIEGAWYLTFNGEWIPSRGGDNFDFTPVAVSDVPVQQPDKLRRLIVDGKQIGAFRDNDNLVKGVQDALKSNPKTIRLEEV